METEKEFYQMAFDDYGDSPLTPLKRCNKIFKELNSILKKKGKEIAIVRLQESFILATQIRNYELRIRTYTHIAYIFGQFMMRCLADEILVLAFNTLPKVKKQSLQLYLQGAIGCAHLSSGSHYPGIQMVRDSREKLIESGTEDDKFCMWQLSKTIQKHIEHPTFLMTGLSDLKVEQEVLDKAEFC